ncbi:unnamed protein product [Chondrus crispus]|uniref:Uncharacterized protein n=1 Tax=Chondrus crispus TaxID=2769 RepID=R7QB85_CHOCR|nr:unnamed protein product [Chondrus crispus]CDF35334.1 unnamed protein product [Chondrus crispus]|eukprot:XP_005715153.1 unnamed protein product [Chondrus crispus]
MDLQTLQTLFHFRGVELWDGITVKLQQCASDFSEEFNKNGARERKNEKKVLC